MSSESAVLTDNQLIVVTVLIDDQSQDTRLYCVGILFTCYLHVIYIQNAVIDTTMGNSNVRATECYLTCKAKRDFHNARPKINV